LILPKKLNIMSREYKIILHDQWTWGDSTPRYGQIIYEDAEIHLYKNQTEDGLLKSLIHEILHGIIEALSIVEIDTNDNAERIIDTLAVGLGDTIIRNKLLK